MQTIKHLFEQQEVGVVKAQDNPLMQSVRQRLRHHQYTHKFSLWKRLSLKSLLDLPIVCVNAADSTTDGSVSSDYVNAEQWDATLVFVNGRWAPETSVVPQGLAVAMQPLSQVSSWSSFLNDMPESEITAPLALSMASQSLCLRVSRSMRIRVCHVLTASGAHAVNLRVHVDSGVSVTCCDVLQDRAEGMTALLCNRDLLLERDAVFEDGHLNQFSASTAWLCCQRVAVQQGGDYQFKQMTAGQGICRFYHQAQLLAEHARCGYQGVALGEGRARFDQTLLVKHLASRTESAQVYKHVVNVQSLTNYSSRVYVAKGIEAVESAQTNHNLVLAASARALTAPELEIYSDEVKCAHGATVGALDAQALYYLRARGLSKALAEALLVQGFIQSMLAVFPVSMRADADAISDYYLDNMPVLS